MVGVKSAKSQFPVAKVPLPMGSEVSCGFRRGSGISELSLRPHTLKYPYMQAGMAKWDHGRVRGGGAGGGAEGRRDGERVLNACQGLIIVSLRRAGVPTAEQR